MVRDQKVVRNCGEMSSQILGEWSGRIASVTGIMICRNKKEQG